MKPLPFKIFKNSRYCDYYTLPQFPFLELTVRKSKSTPLIHTTPKYFWNGSSYADLESVQCAIRDKFIGLCPVSKFSEIPKQLTSIRIATDGWPNNIGGGRAINEYYNGKWYIWVWGIYKDWEVFSTHYAFKFQPNTNLDHVEQWCVKIYNRHLRRLQRLLED